MLRLLIVLIVLLCISASVHAQGAPAAVMRAEIVPFLAVQTNHRVDVHNGPGANFAMVGWFPAGLTVKVIGCNVECAWLQIASAAWIAADEVTPVIAYDMPDGTMGARAPVVVSISAQLPTAIPTVAAPALPTILPLAPTLIPPPTPAVGAEVDETAFRAEAQRIVSDYSTELQQFSTLATAAGNDPALILTETWIAQMGVSIAIIRVLNNDIRALNAPPAFAPAWAEMRAAADKYDQAMDAFITGIDNRDVNQINSAVQLMLEGQEAVNRAATLLPRR